jgi:hypothetical protein
MYNCGTTLLILQSRGRIQRVLNIGPYRLRGRRTSLISPYKKGPTRSVRGAQTAMSPAAHGAHRSNSNVIVLRRYSTHVLGRKIPGNLLGDQPHGKTRCVDSQHAHWMAHRGQFGNARAPPPPTVLAGPRTPYAKEQPPTTSALRYKRSNTSAAGQRSRASSHTTSTRPSLQDDHSGSSLAGSYRAVDNLRQ